jgi:TPR repeat protein
MSAYKVAVLEDDAVPTSGVAVIRIAGLKGWPPGATVRIRPVDEAAVPPKSEGWPWGDITPYRVVPSDGGVDVILGPEVVSSPRLVPGMPVTIEVSAANVVADVRWPAITPTVRRRGNAVAMSAAQLLAAKTERERLEKEAAARRQQMAETAASSAREAAAAETKSGRAAVAPAITQPAEDTGQLARLFPQRRTPIALSPQPNDEGQLARLARVPDTVPAIDGPETRQRARLGTLLLAPAFAAGAAAMAVLMGGVVALAPQWIPRGASASASASPLAAVQIVEHVSVNSLETVFKDIAAVGATSPRRKSAVNVDASTALSLADHSLRGQRTAAEVEEAEFWLKRALGSSLAGQDIAWALTQLGTLYAQSDSPRHSYVKAHVVWQLAAAQGDPVAHCFLGALYEHGLGVAASRTQAREHYATADAANACRSAKDAAVRLKD